MPRKKGIITIILVAGLLLLLLAVYRSCRSGSVPPAERGALDETSYVASADKQDFVEEDVAFGRSANDRSFRRLAVNR